MRTSAPLELSIVLPTLNERANIEQMLPQLRAVAASLVGASFELIVVDGGSSDGTAEAAQRHGALVLRQQLPGYGGALRAGFATARGSYICTCDADLSHPPEFVATLWALRHTADVLVASRYVPGGTAAMPWTRALLSKSLNLLLSRGLSIAVQDLSSGFRLYSRQVLAGLQLQSTHFDVLLEILIGAYADGWRVGEVPFSYHPRLHGRSNARVLPIGVAFLKTFLAMWRKRNSIRCADYDYRAFDTRLLPQRWWQRSRWRIVQEMSPVAGLILDAGCGSSRIIQAVPAVGLDVLTNRVRFVRTTFGRPVVQGTVTRMPFRDEAFDGVICSEVLEHVADGDAALLELARVLKPDGILVLGTPDYGRWTWRAAEAIYHRVVPGGYADEHINQYNRERLETCAKALGLQILRTRYVFGSEMISQLRKTPP